MSDISQVTGSISPYDLEAEMPRDGGNVNAFIRDADAENALDEIRQDSNDFFNSMHQRAEEWKTYAQEQYNQLQSLLENWDDPDNFNVNLELPELGLSDVPFNFDSLSFPSVTIPEDPEAPDASEITFPDTPTFREVPEFTDTPPDLDFSGEPGELELSPPDDPPVLDEPDIPDSPSVTFPEAPALDEIEIPDAIEINMPNFEGERPEFPDIPLPPDFQYSEGEYVSSVFDVLSSKIISQLEEAKSGIDPEVEQAIYDRAKSRQDDEHAKALEEVENYFAAKGFSMPPGALAARVSELNNQRLKAAEDLNNDIIVQRSNLVQQNLQHIMNAGLQLEQVLRSFFNEVQNREMQKQRAVAEHAAQIYSLAVEKYNAQVRAFNTDAEVYKSKVQAELGRVEAFKALVESAKVRADVQQQLVQVYLARLEGVKSMVDVYRTQMESAQIFSQVQMSRIEAYKAGVDAYVARVNAYSAEWQGYQSKVQAQGVKINSFGEKARVHQTEVGAWSTEVEAEINKAKLQLEANQSKLQKYATDVQKYQQVANWKLGKVQSEVSLEDVKSKLASTNVQGKAAEAETRGNNEQRKIAEHELEVNSRIEEMKANLTSKIEEYKLHFEKLKSQSNVMAQISASALSAVSSNMNYGFNGSLTGTIGVQESYANQSSKSENMTLQTSVSHNRSVQGTVSESRRDATNQTEVHNYNYEA